ncbi:alpha/beta hydrolase [Sporomusa acidovorans]|uniref:Acetyl esterase n=1 Tax=Sporomusa acidovorans (strain ATCC 49682 / DSM 3132 / Mol) TaxID=1123286 RepID=A0ABZ3J292_SPOA4|nr:alpha/beta hydrolase [Sporomusa acidovorans]OZC24145.1 acetyl esterase [Sporomusa acidovorans DSM 3132]SDF37234.1 alpha/beta hydrolase fold [Sporomusa acidovorans]
MILKKSIGILTMTGLLMTGLVGSASAADRNADSKTLDFPITKPTVRLISNVIYEQVPSRGYDNVAMGMDVLKPERNEKMPAIIFVTGGGFINANKDNYIQQRMDIANAGYVVASITYRVAPTATFPQPLEDVKAAIRYLRAHADKFNINPEKIGVMGTSAGGYLSAMAGTTNGTKQFDKGEYLNQSSDVQAAVDFYGLSDLTRVGADYSEKVQQAHRSPGATEALWVNGSPVFGGQDGGILVDPEKAKAANPINYISDKTAPFLLMHGDKGYCRISQPNGTFASGADSSRH